MIIRSVSFIAFYCVFMSGFMSFIYFSPLCCCMLIKKRYKRKLLLSDSDGAGTFGGIYV